MAIKGLSIPTFGKYAYNATTPAVTYSEGKTMGHAIEYSADFETADENPLYGDNKIVEHDVSGFSTGTLTLTTSELTNDVSKWLLDLDEVTTGTGNDAFSTLYWNDNAVPITVGFGIIEEHQIDDVTYYKPIIFPKLKPKFNNFAATTRGETVDWQTQQIEFTIERSDVNDHAWMYTPSVMYSSESDAQTWLNTILGVSAG